LTLCGSWQTVFYLMKAMKMKRTIVTLASFAFLALAALPALSQQISRGISVTVYENPT